MPDIETTTTNDEGFAAANHIGEYHVDIDAMGETAPTPNELLVANYASCFSFAFRAAAKRGDYDDLGQIQTEAGADLDEEDDLEAIDFTLLVEAPLTDQEAYDLLGKAEQICHVHAALTEDLHAEVTVESDAF